MAPTALGWHAQRRWRGRIRALLLLVLLVPLILPLMWTFLASFDIKPNNAVWPPTWSLSPSVENYAEVWAAVPGFFQVFRNSISVSMMATLLTTSAAFLAAYSLARGRIRGKSIVVQSFLVMASLPVMAYVIPLADFTRHLGLHDTFVGVALADTAVYTPLAVYILYGYLVQVRGELEEAARLDGASLLQVLWRVVLPAATPGIAATAVLVFVLNWNLFLVPTMLTLSHVKTIPVALSDFYTYERELEWSTAAAALIISLLPAAVLVVMAHRVLEGLRLGPAQGEP